MTPIRTPLVLLLASALLVPSASATLLLPVEQPDALGPWGLQQRQAPGADASAGFAMDVARQALIVTAAGDLDADGVDDLILQSVDLQNGFTTLQAVSGAAPQQVLWSLAPNLGSIPQVVGDLDGDQVTDLVLGQTIDQASSQVQEVGSAAAGTAEAQGAFLFQTLSGASAAGSFGVQLATSTHVTGADLGVVEMLQAGGQHVEQTTGFVQASGTGALHQVEQTVQTTQASLLQALPLHRLTQVEADAVLSVLSATGAVRGQIPLQDPGVNPLMIAGPDLDLDGLADTAIMQIQKVSPVQEASTIVPTISTYTGATVDLAWEATMDPLAGLPLLVPDVGDLNGDGTLELAYHAIEAVPGSDPSGTALTILDGATGEVMGTAQAATGLLIAAPLGGDITGDAQAELLLLEGTVEAITHVAVAGADLEPIWGIDIPADVAPLNLVKDPFTGAVEGLSDLTGDGVPDLAVATASTVGPLQSNGTASAGGQGFELTLYNGLDGSVVWSTAKDAVLAAQAVPGMVQNGSAGVAMVVAEGGQVLENGLQEATGASLLLLQAVDGAEILRLPLVDAEVLASLGDSLALQATVQAAGDLDTDGVEDVIVRLQTVVDDAQTAVVSVQGEAMAASERAFDQVYAVSGRTGEVLQQDIAASAELSAELGLNGTLPVGDVEPLEAYAAQSVEPGANGTPALGVPAVLAAVALALVLVRRRPQ